jgi:signal transduction histidine kinase
MPTFRVCCAALLITGSSVSPLAGQARYFRLLDGRDGLSPSVVTAIAQDRDGLLWIGTPGGLFRYDGARVERWARDRLDTWVATLTVSPDGEIVVIDEKVGALLKVNASGVHDVLGPEGAIKGANQAVFDRAGGLWVSQGPRLKRREPGGDQWTSVPLDSVDGTAPRILVALPGEEILIGTRRAVWRARPGAPPKWLADIPDLVNGLALRDGRVLGITFLGEMIEFGERVTRRPSVGVGRAIALAERNGTLWVSFDRSMVAIGPTGATETLGVAEGITGSGPLLVDHEGSLWMGSLKGLYQFPEPDTRVWGGAHGLPSDHIRYLTRSGDSILVDTWQGPGLIRERAGSWTPELVALPRIGYRREVDREGGIWTGSFQGILRLVQGRLTVPWPHQSFMSKLVEDQSGAIHVTTHRGLLAADSVAGRLTRVTPLPMSSDTALLEFAFIDRSERLWIAGEGRVCARGPDVQPPLQRSTRAPEWSCIDTPGVFPVASLVETASGVLWMALERRGPFRLGANGLEAIPGARSLPSLEVRLVASRRGGFWLVGSGTVMRVVEDTAAADGWRVEERITGWHGLPESNNSDILEDPDGTLWISTALGVVRVPASVRREKPAAPRVVLVEGSVDESRVALDRSVRLPHQRNRLRLRFAGISYRDPLLLRYQVRADDDRPWETITGTPEFRWVDLDAGEYRAEVRASLDGDRWSTDPAMFAFQVLPPWYRTYWAFLLFGSAIAVVAVLVHRSRVAVHVELERQRMRIAMDLHDELGSGLGSIGILAGVLRSSSTHTATDTGRVAKEIGSTAADLGTALSDIVWALDRRSGGLDAVAGRLAEHGNRFFANGAARFTTRFPDSWPAKRLELATRRNILLIGVEALHNAARHSGASSVELCFEIGPFGWILEVTDDGIGLPLDAQRRAGMGLASMRQRAQQIGAQLRWLPGSNGGTTVRLRVPDGSPGGTALPWRRSHAHRRARPPA